MYNSVIVLLGVIDILLYENFTARIEAGVVVLFLDGFCCDG